MNFILLVKEVPDISFINELSWDYKKGVLKRGKIPSCINPSDLKALGFAKELSSRFPGKSAITALSMGPESGRVSLSRLIGMGCSRSVLISDPDFSGSDTYATSYILSEGIRKLRKDISGGKPEYIIISGVNSTDGDTEQVPPQVAQFLDLPLIPCASGITQDNPPGILSLGSSALNITPLLGIPCMITVSDYPYKVYPSFIKLRKSEKTDPVIIWNSDSLGFGKKGNRINLSKTKVIRIYRNENETRRKQIELSSADEIKNIINQEYRNEKKTVDLNMDCFLSEPSDGKNSVWVYAEKRDDSFLLSSRQLISKSKVLASETGTGLTVVCCGASEDMIEYLKSAGSDRVINLYPEPSGLNRDRILSKTIFEIAVKQMPEIFLFPSTPSGRIIASRVACLLKAGLTADCTSLSVVKYKEREKVLVQTRPALGGNIMADIITRKGFLQMATVRGGVFPEKLPLKPVKSSVDHYRIRCDYPDLPVIKDSLIPDELFAEKSELIISIGGGISSLKDLEKYISPFAYSLKTLTGFIPPVAGSRKAVEKGLVGRTFQVGQTGKTVSPKIYIAIGISGAVQHLEGIKGSDIIISVNNDPGAPIIGSSDYYYTGDYKKIIPVLITLFDKKRNEAYA